MIYPAGKNYSAKLLQIDTFMFCLVAFADRSYFLLMQLYNKQKIK